MNAVELKGLTKRYPGGKGIEDVNLEVPTGEIFGFIGPNGAGKSTTLRLLMGLLRPTRGEARLFGRDVFTEGPEMRTDVGYVPNEPALYENMTVGEVLEWFGSFRPGPSAGRRRLLCEALDLDPTRAAEDLSLGNKKKVALVAAMQHAPKLLVLDEPTNGLDPLIQRRLFELLAEEHRQGATIFFSSHVLAEVQRVCSRVAIIREGRLVETARIDALRTHHTKRVSLLKKGAASRVLSLSGVGGIEQDGERVRFVYSGELPALLHALATDGVVDVNIEEPSLEEAFMRHYGASNTESNHGNVSHTVA